MTIQQQLGSMTIIPDATAVRLARYFEPLLSEASEGPVKRFIHSGTIEADLLYSIGTVFNISAAITAEVVADTHPQAEHDQHAMMAELRALAAYLFAAGVRGTQETWGKRYQGDADDGVVPWCYGRPSAKP